MSTPNPWAGGLALRLSAAFLIVGPAVIHFAVVPEHLTFFLPYGIFLLCVALAQVALAAAIVLRPSPVLLLGGAAGTLVVIGIWVVSRTTGLPLAPVPYAPEPIGLPDLLTTYMEFAAVILMLLADWRLKRNGARFRLLTAAPGVLVALLFSLAFTLFSLVGVAAVSGHQ